MLLSETGKKALYRWTRKGTCNKQISNLLITPPLGPIILFGVYYHLTNTETLLVRGPFISKPIDRRRETTVFPKKESKNGKVVVLVWDGPNLKQTKPNQRAFQWSL